MLSKESAGHFVSFLRKRVGRAMVVISREQHVYQSSNDTVECVEVRQGAGWEDIPVHF